MDQVESMHYFASSLLGVPTISRARGQTVASGVLAVR